MIEANRYSRQQAPALLYLRPSMGSDLLNLTSMEGGNVLFCMEQNRPFSRISKASNVACRALPFALNISRPLGGSQTSHFCVALTYKGTSILSSMRLEFKSLRDSELITYLMKPILVQASLSPCRLFIKAG